MKDLITRDLFNDAPKSYYVVAMREGYAVKQANGQLVQSFKAYAQALELLRKLGA